MVNGMSATARAVLLGTTALSLLLAPAAAHAQALPSGGTVIHGDAAISQSGSSLLITQSSQHAIFDWNSFSIGAGASAHFDNGTGATLNRVTGHLPSAIDGSLTATGSLYLVNPAGIAVGTGGMVRTGGSFVASTHDVTDDDFLDGGDLVLSGNSRAGIVNEGLIAALGGDVVLTARRVENRGTILAEQGDVGLLAGYEVLLRDLATDDGKFAVRVGGADTETINSGTIAAANAELRANGGNVYALAGNTKGIITATGVKRQGGRIFLTGGEGGTVTATQRIVARAVASAPKSQETKSQERASAGIVRISADRVTLGGEIDVSGDTLPGGTIIAVAREQLELAADAALDASGSEGGLILVGGDYQGGADAANAYWHEGIGTTRTVLVAGGATLRADGATGAGGNVVVWSDGHTGFAGTISATGATRGGDAEVSGKQTLAYAGFADLSAGTGAFGTLLLDPYNVTIADAPNSGHAGFTATANDSVINAATLATALGAANVTVSTGAGGTQAGDIRLVEALSWSSGTLLTLNAAGSIAIDNIVTIDGSGGLALNYDAVNGAASFAGLVQYTGSGGRLSMNGESYELLYSMADLQGINTDARLSGRYALATSLDAIGVTDWVPLGTDGTGAMNGVLNGGKGFTGSFTGLGNVIDNLNINIELGYPDLDRAPNHVGLFGFARGSISDIGLRGGHVKGRVFVGGLVGYLDEGGSIARSYNTGRVTARTNFGGLVGMASKASVIVESYATGEINGDDTGGGLVGFLDVGAEIYRSYATGLVNPSYGTAGGLVGYSGGRIVQSYATGLTGGGKEIGGLAGVNSGIILQSYAAGEGVGVSAVGGLAGVNYGIIQQSYATGDVEGSKAIGGLVGHNFGSIIESYAKGHVSGTSEVGGLIGNAEPLSSMFGQEAIVADSYFDNDTTGQQLGAGKGAQDGISALSSIGGSAFDKASYAEWDWTVWAPPSAAGGGAPAYYPELYGVSGVVGVDYSGTATYGDPAASLGAPTVYGIGYFNRWTAVPTAPALPGGGRPDAGSYAVLGSGGEATFITGAASRIVHLPGTLTITPRPITVTAQSGTSIYGNGGSNPGFTATNLASGETVAILTGLSNNFGIAGPTGVGTYTLAVVGDLANPNYTITGRHTATWTVTPRPITVTVDDLWRFYGEGNPALIPIAGGMGLVNGDTLTGTPATTADQTSDVGTYAITRGSLAASPNYDMTFIGGTLTVTPRTIIVLAPSESRVYGDDNPPLLPVVDGMGLVNGDTLTGALATAAGRTSDVGAYAITRGSLAASSNYDMTFIGGTLTVTPRAIIVTATSGSRVYGAANPPLAYTVGGSGLANGDLLGGGLATAAETDSNVGSYAITQGTLTEANNPNYAISFVGGTLLVTPRAVTVAADNLGKRLGEADPALTWRIVAGSLAGFDTTGTVFTGGLARDPGELPGAYAIGQGTLLANANYDLAFLGGTLLIDPVAITLSSPLERAAPLFGQSPQLGDEGFALCVAGVLPEASCATYIHPANRGLDHVRFTP